MCVRRRRRQWYFGKLLPSALRSRPMNHGMSIRCDRHESATIHRCNDGQSRPRLTANLDWARSARRQPPAFDCGSIVRPEQVTLTARLAAGSNGPARPPFQPTPGEARSEREVYLSDGVRGECKEMDSVSGSNHSPNVQQPQFLQPEPGNVIPHGWRVCFAESHRVGMLTGMDNGCRNQQASHRKCPGGDSYLARLLLSFIAPCR